MEATLRTILTLLNTKPVKTLEIVRLLEDRNVTEVLDFSNLTGILENYDEEYVKDEIVEYIKNYIEVIIEENNERMEEKTKESIIEKTFSNFREIVTANLNVTTDNSTITQYNKEDDSKLEYYVLGTNIEKSIFTYRDFIFSIEGINPVYYKNKNNEEKHVFYKYKVTVSYKNKRFNINDAVISVLLSVMGMSFINTTDYNEFTSEPSEDKSKDIITINTKPFFEKLVLDYNSYYNNIVNYEEKPLSTYKGIDVCYVEDLILVPKLFYLSYLYLDGDIKAPFIFKDNEALKELKLSRRNSKLSISVSKDFGETKAREICKIFIENMLKLGIILKLKAIKSNDKTNNYTCQLSLHEIDEYKDDKEYQSDISAILSYERKVSETIKALVRQNKMSVRTIKIGSEIYSFSINNNDLEIDVSNRPPITLYYNRSIFIDYNDPYSTEIVNSVRERNHHKDIYTKDFTNSFINHGGFIPYDNKLWPDVYTNYIPTSLIGIDYEFKKDEIKENYKGISFLPFGFIKYISLQSDTNVYRGIYNSIFNFEQAAVTKVIKISNNKTSTHNITQIVIETSEEPVFDKIVPLKYFRLNHNHYLCLLKSYDEEAFFNNSNYTWFYASDYVQNNNLSKDINTGVSNFTICLNNEVPNSFFKSSLLRYFMETATVNDGFSNFLIDNANYIFKNSYNDVYSLCDFIIEQRIIISNIPFNFFKLLRNVSENNDITDKTVDWLTFSTVSTFEYEMKQYIHDNLFDYIYKIISLIIINFNKKNVDHVSVFEIFKDKNIFEKLGDISEKILSDDFYRTSFFRNFMYPFIDKTLFHNLSGEDFNNSKVIDELIMSYIPVNNKEDLTTKIFQKYFTSRELEILDNFLNYEFTPVKVTKWIYFLIDLQIMYNNLTSCVESIKIFIRSIKKPVKYTDIPYYTNDMERKIMNKFHSDIDGNISEFNNILNSMEILSIKNIRMETTKHNDILKYLFNSLVGKLEDNNDVISEEDFERFKGKIDTIKRHNAEVYSRLKSLSGVQYKIFDSIFNKYMEEYYTLYHLVINEVKEGSNISKNNFKIYEKEMEIYEQLGNFLAKKEVVDGKEVIPTEREYYERKNYLLKDLETKNIGIPSNQLNKYKNEAISDIKNLTIDNFTGKKITLNFIQEASETLDDLLFKRIFEEIYRDISTDSYEDDLTQEFEEVLDADLFKINEVSPYRYTITFNSNLEDKVLSFNGHVIRKVPLVMDIFNQKEHIFEFGKYIFNSNIHCMFKVTYSNKDIKNVIKDTLEDGNIFYTQIGNEHYLTDLSIVSIYNESIVDTNNTVLFFLPFIHDGGRLTVDSTNWINNNCNFQVLNKCMEIEFIAEEVNEHSEIITDCILNDFILFNTENYEALRNVSMSHTPVTKSFNDSNKISYYVIAEDLNTKITSGNYTTDTENYPQTLIDNGIEEFEVYIYPVPSTVSKYYFKIKFQQIDSQQINEIQSKLKELCSRYNINYKNADGVVSNFIMDKGNYFVSDFINYTIHDDEILVIHNEKGVYTKSYGNKEIESMMAEGINIFNNKLSSYNYDTSDVIMKLEENLIKEKIDKENDEIIFKNSLHNLSFLTSNAVWNSKNIENYKFYSNEKPKWIKFSDDSYYMGVGFQSGVKMHIKYSDRYVFCGNLNHVGVSDIIFGNEKFCITLQYEDSTLPFGIVWFSSAAIKLPINIDYYKPIAGDLVNVTYISKTNKSKNNVILEEDPNGKKKYKNNYLQSYTPSFNHNVYFFSQNDKYLLHNKKGTITVIDMNTLTPIKFEKINGKDNKGRIIVKCIEDGKWIGNVFIGTNYSHNQTGDIKRQRIVIDVDLKTIDEFLLRPDYPIDEITENLLIEKSVEIHPLYSYLMNKRSEIKNNKNSVWIYDVFITSEYYEDTNTTLLMFESIWGYYCEFEINNIENLIDLVSSFEYALLKDINGIKVKKIYTNNNIIYDVNKSSRIKDNKLQYLDGNYYSFVDESIYVWKYIYVEDSCKTEITHITMNGYEKLEIDTDVIVLTNGNVKLGVVDGTGTILVKNINLTTNIDFKKESKDVSEIVESINETYTVPYYVRTRTCFENYTHKQDIPNYKIFTKAIASSLCANRFENFHLNTHTDAADFEEFDNFLISTDNNVVKIYPKYVQIEDKNSGMHSKWYQENKGKTKDEWYQKYKTCKEYVKDIKEVIPQLDVKRDNSMFYNSLKDLFKNVGTTITSDELLGMESDMYSTGLDINIVLDELDPNMYTDEFKDIVRYIYNIFSDSKAIFSYINVNDYIKQYWKSKEGPIKNYLSNFKNTNVEYNNMIQKLSFIHGNVFLSYEVNLAFNKIDEIKDTHKNINDAKNFFEDSLKNNTDEFYTTVIEIILKILNIPIKYSFIININNYELFKEQFNKLKHNISIYRRMSEDTTNFEKYKIMERDYYDELVIRSIAFSGKTLNEKILDEDLQSYPDYIYAMLYPDDEFIDLPDIYHTLVDKFDIIEDFLDENKVGIFGKGGIDVNKIIELLKIDSFENSHVGDNDYNGNKSVVFTNDDSNSEVSKYTEYLLQILYEDDDDRELLHKQIVDIFQKISMYYNTFINVNSLFDLIDKILYYRFDEFNKRDKSLFSKIVETYDKVLTEEDEEDEDYQVLEFYNINHINEELKTVKNNINTKKFVPADFYSNEEFNEMQGKLISLLTEYKNGVSQENIPVTVIEIHFSNEVEFNPKNEYTKDEKDDINFKYKVSDSEDKYVDISINLYDIISSWNSRDSGDDKVQSINDLIINFNYSKKHNLKFDTNILKLFKEHIPSVSDSSNVDDIVVSLENIFSSKYTNMETITLDKNRSIHKGKVKLHTDIKRIKTQLLSLPYLSFHIKPFDHIYEYKYAGIDFSNEYKYKLLYNSKHANIFNEQVNFKRVPFSIGVFNPYYYQPTLIKDNLGKPYIFNTIDEKFIVYYGNTKQNNMDKGFIVKQNIMDGKTTSYIYSGPKDRISGLEDYTYITKIHKIDSQGNFEFIEKMNERKRINGEFEIVRVDKIKRYNIDSLLSNFTQVENLSEDTFKNMRITDKFFVQKDSYVAIVCNYMDTSFNTSTVEVFRVNGSDKTKLYSWNFRFLTITSLDFNDKHVAIVGTTKSYSGTSIKFGLMNINMNKTEKCVDTFVNFFDTNIEVNKSEEKSVHNFTCNIGEFKSSSRGTTYYVTYNKLGNENKGHIIIRNKYKVNEIELNYNINSVKVSNKNGYIAVYFKDFDKTEIWNYNGSLQETINGKCSWM